MGHRHITKRTFKVNCRDCGKPILFWECADCGAKTFFSLPIYGKPIRHICEKYLHPATKPLPPWRTVKETIDRKPLDVKEVGIYQCPVCDKTFSNEIGLNNHINQLKKLDENHNIFFNKTLDLIDFSYEESKIDQSVKLDLKNVEKVGAYGMRIKRKKPKKKK